MKDLGTAQLSSSAAQLHQASPRLSCSFLHHFNTASFSPPA